MKNQSKKTQMRFTPSRSGLLVLLLALMLVGWGCDDNSKVITESNKSDDADTNHGHTDDAGHGPDEDVQTIENGFMTGSWRVGLVEDQSLVVNLDTFQEKGNPEVSGYFTMGMLAENGADSKSGDIFAETSSFDGETLIVKWNPTDVADEVYTIEAVKEDENTLTGTVSAAIFTDINAEIRITRYAAPPVGEDENAGDIDAGEQGGAG